MQSITQFSGIQSEEKCDALLHHKLHGNGKLCKQQQHRFLEKYKWWSTQWFPDDWKQPNQTTKEEPIQIMLRVRNWMNSNNWDIKTQTGHKEPLNVKSPKNRDGSRSWFSYVPILQQHQ
jgi:hypothetical protein